MDIDKVTQYLDKHRVSTNTYNTEKAAKLASMFAPMTWYLDKIAYVKGETSVNQLTFTTQEESKANYEAQQQSIASSN